MQRMARSSRRVVRNLPSRSGRAKSRQRLGNGCAAAGAAAAAARAASAAAGRWLGSRSAGSGASSAMHAYAAEPRRSQRSRDDADGQRAGAFTWPCVAEERLLRRARANSAAFM